MITSRHLSNKRRWSSIGWWMLLIGTIVYVLYGRIVKKASVDENTPLSTLETKSVNRHVKQKDLNLKHVTKSSRETIPKKIVEPEPPIKESKTFDGSDIEEKQIVTPLKHHWKINKPKVEEKTEWIFTPDVSVPRTKEKPRNSTRPWLLVAVFTTAENLAFRNGIRASWYLPTSSHTRSLRHHPDIFRVIFVMGHGHTDNLQTEIKEEAQEFGDILQMGFHDSPYEYTRKMINLMKWIKREPTYSKEKSKPLFLLKVLDNVYINFPALIHWLEAKFPSESSRKDVYMGEIVHKDSPIRDPNHPLFISQSDYPEEYFPAFIRSPIYLFSWDTLIKLTSQLSQVRPLLMEDAYIGLLAIKAEIKPVHNEHFILIGRPDNVCHHLRMFFVAVTKAMDHVTMFRNHAHARQSPECAGMLSYEEEAAKLDL